jgi:tetratricopeptide (TPR) repeat protein
MAMAEAGAYVVNLTNIHRRKTEIMAAADVLILKNISDPDLLPLIHDRSARERVTVYEIADDLHAIPSWNPVSPFFEDRENLCVVCQTAQSCDALQVSVPELKNRYRCLKTGCAVFQNQIPHVPPPRRRKSQENVVIGWGGSNGHLQDMAAIADPFQMWITQTSNVRLHLMSSNAIWDLFSALPPEKKQYTSPGSINDYYEFLGEIDIGIAPLNDTTFNRSRSDVKFLEYAVSEVVPVMQFREPYRQAVRPNETGYLFTDAEDMIGILNKLLRTPLLITEIAGKARQYILDERLQRHHAKDRIMYYERLLRNKNKTSSMGEAKRLFSKWSGLEGAVRYDRNLQLTATKYEKLVYEGLLTLMAKHRRGEGQDLFKSASELQPEQYLPFLFGSAVSHDPMVCLEKALERNPLSLKSWVLLGEQFAGQGRVRDALTCFQRASEICPNYLVPLLKVHSLLLALGEKIQAANLLNKLRHLHSECLLNSLLNHEQEQCNIHRSHIARNSALESSTSSFPGNAL